MNATVLDRSGECTYRCTYASTSRLRARLRPRSTSHNDCAPGNTQKFSRTCLRTCVPSLVMWAYSRRDAGWPSKEDPTKRFFVLFPRRKRCVGRELGKLLYSVSEAAVLLSCSRNTVYGLIKSGELLAVHPTSKARISRGSLERFVQLKEDEARSERQAQRSLTR